MNTSSLINTKMRIGALITILLVSVTTTALADRDDRNHGHGGARDGWVLDHRYNHDHYYPPRGYVVRGLPRSSITVRVGGGPYYFNEGIWYRPGRAGYAVVSAPLGAFLPILPPYYSTAWFGGVPYYYADDAYYVRDANRNGYVVTNPPDSEPANATSNSSDDVFTYPKNGQSAEQQATDRYECHRWAADQTGFDVTQPQGGVNNVQVASKRADYRRAQAACLEGRGYTVK